MPQTIYVNLPVRDVAAATRYYEALGYRKNDQFTGDTAASIVVSDTIIITLMAREQFASLSQRPIADPHAQIQCFHTLSCDSRADVDTIADKAIAAGGTQHSDADAYDFMYSRPVIDLDGHVWNYLWMDAGKMGV